MKIYSVTLWEVVRELSQQACFAHVGGAKLRASIRRTIRSHRIGKKWDYRNVFYRDEITHTKRGTAIYLREDDLFFIGKFLDFRCPQCGSAENPWEGLFPPDATDTTRFLSMPWPSGLKVCCWQCSDEEIPAAEQDLVEVRTIINQLEKEITHAHHRQPSR